VLGSYFLNEKLGTLGKLGCATCLIGSVVIVLHAPPDREIETVDEILNLAVQPGMCFTRHFSDARGLTSYRLLVLHRDCGNIRKHHDIPRCAKIWPQEPPCLHIHLFDSRLCIRHVDQGIRYRPETHSRRQQSVYASVDIRVHHRGSRLHSHADELLQQSFESILDEYVSIHEEEVHLTLLTLNPASIPYTTLHSPPPLSQPPSSSSVASTRPTPSTQSPSCAASSSSSLVSTFSTSPETTPKVTSSWPNALNAANHSAYMATTKPSPPTQSAPSPPGTACSRGKAANTPVEVMAV